MSYATTLEEVLALRSENAELKKQLEYARAALQRITVFQVEEDRRIHVRVCGEELLPAQPGTSSARALLEFDAIQKLALTDEQST